MKAITSYKALDELGRVRLSEHFFMRDFLYSEIANFHGKPNLPEHPDRAIEAGKHLCNELLEPLNATFGRIAIRSAYRSPTVNAFGQENKLNCASNEKNFAHHIWDVPDAEGCIGATACIVIPWFTNRYTQGADWRSLAYWIHDHLPYSEMEFFDGQGLCAFNLNWHQKPKKNISSYMSPRTLLKDGHDAGPFSDHYPDFPTPQGLERAQ